MKKITIITGHYGSGKTNLSVNLAVRAAEEGKSAAVVDLDIVNPYFRTADFRQLFEEKGIKLIAPDFACSNLDIPSIQFDVEQLAASEDCLIIDVGGDDAGATALGRYAEALSKYGDSLEMLYVVNQRRYLTASPEEAVTLMYEIEAAARMRHTAIVNNTNLGCETTFDIVEGSRRFAESISRKTGLPIAFTVYPEQCAELSDSSDVFEAKIYVKPIWD
ncbi:MAG TPA: cobalamin biosynthesis protein CobQ [Ruminococcus sp.]